MRQLKKTPDLERRLRDSVGNDADLTSLAVFETIAINTLPIRKVGTLFENARMNVSLLRAMSEFVNKEKQVPLQLMHDVSENLPVGRVFASDLVDAKGVNGEDVTELRHLFYISSATDEGKALIAKLDSGTINEVSVGVRSKHIRCSECGFDYMSDEAGIIHILTRTCENEHTIGKDGVYARLDGLDRYFEMSLVSRGAADHALIQERRQAVMAKEEMKLAASESKESNSIALILHAMKTEGETTMNLTEKEYNEFVASLRATAKEPLEAKFSAVVTFFDQFPKELVVEKKDEMTSALEAAMKEFKKPEPSNFTITFDEVVALKASEKSLTEKVSALEKHNGELTTALAAKGTEVTTLQAQVKTLESDRVEKVEAVAFLKQIAEKCVVAAGMKDKTIPETTKELVALLTEVQGKLSKFPTGGVALPADTGSASTNTVTAGADSAFQSKSSVFRKGA